VFDGKRHMSQFLRLKSAAALSVVGSPPTNARQALADAGELEVGGYMLSEVLTSQIEQVSLEQGINPALGQLTWIEVVRDTETPISAQSLTMIKRHVATGGSVIEEKISGPPFYAAVEIAEIGELVARSVRAFAARDM